MKAWLAYGPMYGECVAYSVVHNFICIDLLKACKWSLLSLGSNQSKKGAFLYFYPIFFNSSSFDFSYY